MPGQSEQLLVARDEQVGFAAGGQLQKLLVIGIAAARKGSIVSVGGFVPGDEAKIGSQQFILTCPVEIEFGIGGDALQFAEASSVAETEDMAPGYGVFQPVRARVLKMKHVHDNIGVENQSHPRCRFTVEHR